MENEKENQNIHVALRILSYLVDNPEAEDTFEGITEWWLSQQNLAVEVKKVKAALAELLDKGLITEIRGLDNRTYYRINKAKYDEIHQVLKDMKL